MGDSHGNGRSVVNSDFWRWLIGVGAAAVVAYFTTIGAIQAEVSEIRTRQDSQFSEVLRRLDLMQQDIRELRNKP